MSVVKKKIAKKKVVKAVKVTKEVKGSFVTNQDGVVIKTSKGVVKVSKGRDGSYTVQIKVDAPKIKKVKVVAKPSDEAVVVKAKKTVKNKAAVKTA